MSGAIADSIHADHPFFTASFLCWLLCQIRREDAIGDLARDVQADRRSGCLHSQTARGIERHIIRRHAAQQGVLTALGRARLDYEAAFRGIRP